MKSMRSFVIAVLCFAAVLAACTGGSDNGSSLNNSAAVYPRFAYVANSGDNTVSIYTMDAATGQMRANGYVVVGTTPYAVTVDPSGRFAYVANRDSNDVYAYRINQSTGALTLAGTVAGSQPYSISIDPSGKFAYGQIPSQIVFPLTASTRPPGH